ncbi:TPA: helix-turn-helix domain-containing protein [Streptococcus suis]|nr:helix-turn-helix domain-containing protein [Streptococcus suis]HEM4975112.1 helix-turn-helix domain-containing protein [Streptococcus suis]HEM5288956.1 helix-turn-helix domain-containing protein [Streptococcus suis]HEM5299147.1 helix-turn-helix domain-containing protein [Streptococcus suis]HEM5302674.1 helix-turn-helix domain-containing protein [Streptococcus suis]
MAEEKNYFALNLKFLRQKQGMEQIDLANRLGRKSSSSVSEWERGKYTPKAGVLNDIAKIFDVSLSQLMSSDLSNPSPSPTKEPTPTIDFKEVAAESMSYDGLPLNDEDIDLIASILETRMKNRDKE